MTESQDNTINANLTPLPDKVGVDGLEDKWRGVWDESGVYKFQGTRDRKAVYSIDTPAAHRFRATCTSATCSPHTHTDVIARFKRMNGYDVFYPMGWDDNGLPTERRVQNYYGVRVDTSLKYDPNFVPPRSKAPMARRSTPRTRCRSPVRTSSNCVKSSPPRTRSSSRRCGAPSACPSTGRRPTTPSASIRSAWPRKRSCATWLAERRIRRTPRACGTTFQTAVAQAELESREYPGFYHKLAFRFEDGTPDLHRDHPSGTAGRLRR